MWSYSVVGPCSGVRSSHLQALPSHLVPANDVDGRAILYIMMYYDAAAGAGRDV